MILFALSVVAVAGLTIALVPLGVRVLRDGPTPPAAAVARWSTLVLIVFVGMMLLGTAG